MQTSFNQNYQAQLQAIGIDLYQSVEGLEVEKQKWLGDVVALIDISLEDIIYKGNTPKYDIDNKSLQLPLMFYGNEQALKRSIWQAIQPFVNVVE